MGRKPSVAVCAPQTPFVNGGAELAVRALARELGARDYPVEIVRVPFTWQKAELLQNALVWRLVRVAADFCIVTSFPSYFLHHPGKVLWLFHQHRALYELYGTSFSDWGTQPEDAEVRRVIIAADTRFIGETGRRFTISQNLSDRLQRFNGVSSEPLYHPPPLHGRLECRGYGDFVLMPTRLERHKRPELLIEALRCTRSPVQAVIAGTGPEEEALRTAVERHGLGKRVQFAGYVDDATLIDLYATCGAVFYAPFDEDYGYVSLEAFCAKKPVVTTTDAGGPLEFVVDAVNGFVCPPDAEAIGTALDRLAAAPGQAASLGEAGYDRARTVTWAGVVERLVGAAATPDSAT